MYGCLLMIQLITRDSLGIDMIPRSLMLEYCVEATNGIGSSLLQLIIDEPQSIKFDRSVTSRILI